MRLRDQVHRPEGVPRWTIVKRFGGWRAYSPGPATWARGHLDAWFRTHSQAVTYVLAMKRYEKNLS